VSHRAFMIAPMICLLVTLTPAPRALAEPIHLIHGTFDPVLEEPEIDPTLRAEPLRGTDTGHFLVQLNGPPTEERQSNVRRLGAKLVAYVPDNAYIAELDASGLARIVGSPDVRWAGPFHPAYKISPTIGTHEFADPLRAADSFLTLRVRVFAEMERTADAIRSLGAQVTEALDNGFQKLLIVSAAPGLVGAIARIDDVWWIEEDPEFYLMNDTGVWVCQTNVVGSTPIWDHGLHGENEIVAVMDSGIDYNSCWFRDGGAAPGPTHRKVIDYQLYGGGIAYDGCDVGHGTHVCGTLAGDQSYVNPGNIVCNGIAYKAKLMMQDIGADDEWSCLSGQIQVPTSCWAAYADAYGGGARIHSNSWGSTENSYDSYAADVDNFMWQNADFLIVFAAGNSGPAASTVSYPGTAKNCITVGATRRPPDQHVIAGYSSRGPANDGRIKPTVCAPGGEAAYSYVNSADNDTGNPPAQTCAIANSPFQGTSMATPAVAGCAALTRQYFRDGWYPSGAAEPGDAFAPSGALLKAVITNAGCDISTADIPNHNEGWGRVLLEDALYFDGDARELIVEDVTPGVGQGGNQTFDLEVDSSSIPLEIVLVWTDYPASPGASVAIQNDLDLTVSSPGGTTLNGNVMSGGQSVSGGTADARNVEEVVRLNSPTPGTYTITVAGAIVPHAPQPFALACTGSFADWPPSSAVPGSPPANGERRLAIECVSPNPFNPTTSITYELFRAPRGTARANLTIYAVDGRVVARLVDRVQDPGRYKITWNGRDTGGAEVASGVYLVELQYGGESDTRKMTLLK